jgi:hypothetical protein
MCTATACHRDPHLAENWLLKAAKKGDADAQRALRLLNAAAHRVAKDQGEPARIEAACQQHIHWLQHVTSGGIGAVNYWLNQRRILRSAQGSAIFCTLETVSNMGVAAIPQREFPARSKVRMSGHCGRQSRGRNKSHSGDRFQPPAFLACPMPVSIILICNLRSISCASRGRRAMRARAGRSMGSSPKTLSIRSRSLVRPRSRIRQDAPATRSPASSAAGSAAPACDAA